MLFNFLLNFQEFSSRNQFISPNITEKNSQQYKKKKDFRGNPCLNNPHAKNQDVFSKFYKLFYNNINKQV